MFDPIAPNIMEVTATTYAWKLIELDQWFPADPTDLQTAFSLHIFNGDCWEPSAVAVEEIPVQPFLTSYPNPASDLLFVELANTDGSNVMLEISDALCRVIIQQSANKGKNVIQVNGLAVGTYQVTAHAEVKGHCMDVL